MKTQNKMSTQKLVLGALLTALVIVLQLMGAFIKLGPFSISLVLVPIVIGAAMCGKGIATWLGFAFGFAVIASGDATFFMAVSVPGTIITVFAKGIACGLVAAIVFDALKNRNLYLAVVVSAIVCPIVNTGVFLIGCNIFFLDTVTQMAGGANVYLFMITGLVGLNFIVELITNIILSPIIVRILNIKKS